MKKIISVLLCVIMMFSLVSVAATAADAELIITVANDLHYNHQAATAPAKATEDYAHVPSQGQLKYENELIIDAFLKEAASNESSVILLPGDIVDRGTEEEYSVMVAKLSAFEKSSGKSVYVVPGNHEVQYSKTPSVEIMNTFAEFGYNEAIAKDTNSASYVVDLPGGYRLLAIDSTKAGDGVHGMTEERAEWIEAQAAKAQKDGKKTIAMMHHNLVEHFVLGNVLHAASVIDEEYGVQEIFTKYNVKYNFVGHTHEHDIATYTGENGNTFYSIVTGSLNAAPCPYRVVTFGDEVKIQTRRITSVDMSSLKGIITDNCYNLAVSDFTEYADRCFSAGFSQILDQYLKASMLISLLGLDKTEDAEMCELINTLTPAIREAVFMPIYTYDEPFEGYSLQSIAKKFNFEMPESEYETFAELALFIYSAHVYGDENYGILSTEYVLLTSIVTALLGHVLKDVSAEDYATALNFICSELNIKTPTNFYKYAATEITKIEGIEILLSAGLSSVLLQFTTDEGPEDNNVTLPGFATQAEIEEEAKNLTFWEKIMNFFRSFFDKILRFFGIGK